MNRKALVILTYFLFMCANTFGQDGQYTKNTADQTLRSTGRVNPSSLALEMDVPLGSYPGRGINLPLGLSYSSKLWRFQEALRYYLTGGGERVYAEAKYAEDSAAGWTSSLSQPYIEYVGETNRFDVVGKPLPDELAGPSGSAPYGNIFVKRIMVFLPGGESHELRAQEEPIWISDSNAPPESVWNTTFYATDGSGIKYVQDSAATPKVFKLYLADGSYWDFNELRVDKSSTDFAQVRRGTRLTDVHGNYVQFNAPSTGLPNGSWTDQLGRTFPIMIPQETPTLTSSEDVLEQSSYESGPGCAWTLLSKRRLRHDVSSPGEEACYWQWRSLFRCIRAPEACNSN